MPLNEPGWWYPDHKASSPWQAYALAPVSQFYQWVADRRLLSGPKHTASQPVICVGNFTVGGTGKTPLSIWLASELSNRGLRPTVLTRGYGGQLPGPVWVNTTLHTSDDVGDEPLVIASHVPVVVSRDRKAGALAIGQGDARCDAIIMDDGLQNPTLHKDLSIAVIDGTRGFGNGWVIPSGPLRASLQTQLGRVSAIVVNLPGNAAGQGVPAEITRQLQEFGFQGVTLTMRLRPVGDIAWLKGARVLAFAGIGNPTRFFNTLKLSGADVIKATTFPDHHRMNEHEARTLVDAARQTDARLVTTEKDWARLTQKGAAFDQLRDQTDVLKVAASFSQEDAETLRQLLPV